MEAVLAAIVSAIVSLTVALISFRQSRRDTEMRERQLAESVTSELIRQRIAPYSDFMAGMTCVSSKHDTVQGFDREHIHQLVEVIQSAIYGPIGLLCNT